MFFIGNSFPSTMKKLDERFRPGMREKGPNVPYTDTEFDGVLVRVFDDQKTGEISTKRPAIVFYHGGGWRLGHIGEYFAAAVDLKLIITLIIIIHEFLLKLF